MKRLGAIIVGLTIFGSVVCAGLSATVIPAGYTGVVYSLNGGIQDKTLSQGFHMVSPLKHVIKYSTSTVQGAMSADEREDSPTDESFLVPTKDGKTVRVDLEYSFHFPQETLGDLFTKFKGENGDHIKNVFMRTKLKAWTAEVTSQYSVLDIYGDQRQQLNLAVQKHLQEKFKPFFIEIETANLSNIVLDEATAQAIQKRINATQELEQQKIETEKAKQIQLRKLIEAETSAKEKIITAEAEAKSNQTVANSLTPELLKLKELQARYKHGWVTIQGATPIVQADK